MRRDIDRAEQRARRYWYDDGLAEIAAGCGFIAIGLLFLAEAFGAIPPGASSLGLIVVVFGGWALAGRLIRVAKERLVYPRTGYVRYRRPEGRRRSRLVTGAVAGAIGALVGGLLSLAPASLAWIPLLDGVAVGAFLLYLGNSLGLVRFYLLVVVSVALGAAGSLAGLGDSLGSGAYFATMGLALVASGLLTLATYLRNTRPPEGE